MRVLLELNGKRVDIKTPISSRHKIEETMPKLKELIEDAKVAMEG